jgi:hypothetical protein
MDDAEEEVCDVGAEKAKAVVPEKSSEELVVCVDRLLRKLADWSSRLSSLLKGIIWRGPEAS